MKEFQAKRLVCCYEENIKTSRDNIFRLTCPVAELKWIENWKDMHTLIYTESGVNENNCIFIEYKMLGQILFDEPVKATWVTTLHDAETGKIQFLIILEDRGVIKFDIDGKEHENGTITAIWHFTYTSLSEKGNAIPDKTFKERMLAVQKELAQMLKYYCETGKMLRMDKA
ncbi:MAG: hypothetical protein KJ737_21100 [Proteobacteria bacterium]|nr:hypothetical protein [Pseudomonadota bacterium]